MFQTVDPILCFEQTLPFLSVDEQSILFEASRPNRLFFKANKIMRSLDCVFVFTDFTLEDAVNKVGAK